QAFVGPLTDVVVRDLRQRNHDAARHWLALLGEDAEVERNDRHVVHLRGREGGEAVLQQIAPLQQIGVVVLTGDRYERQAHRLHRLEGGRRVRACLAPDANDIRMRGQQALHLGQGRSLVVLDVRGAYDLHVWILREDFLGAGPAGLADGDAGRTV